MIFLIEYDRKEGRIVTFRDFDDSQRRKAEERAPRGLQPRGEKPAPEVQP